MAKIDISEVEGLLSLEHFYLHGESMLALSLLGVPVLYAPESLLDGVADKDDPEGHLLEALRPRIGRALAELLLSGGDLAPWQATPVDVDPPY